MCPFYGIFHMRDFVIDIGTEELAHLEMFATIVHQLTRNKLTDLDTTTIATNANLQSEYDSILTEIVSAQNKSFGRQYN